MVKGSKKEKVMGNRYTIRFDNDHLKVLEMIIKKKNLKNKSEAIRYLIEQYNINK